MTLIKCPKCQRKISDRQERCPHCGFGVKDYFAKLQELKNIQTENPLVKKEPIQSDSPSAFKKYLLFSGSIIGAVVMLILSFQSIDQQLGHKINVNESGPVETTENKKTDEELTEYVKFLLSKQRYEEAREVFEEIEEKDEDMLGDLFWEGTEDVMSRSGESDIKSICQKIRDFQEYDEETRARIDGYIEKALEEEDYLLAKNYLVLKYTYDNSPDLKREDGDGLRELMAKLFEAGEYAASKRIYSYIDPETLTEEDRNYYDKLMALDSLRLKKQISLEEFKLLESEPDLVLRKQDQRIMSDAGEALSEIKGVYSGGRPYYMYIDENMFIWGDEMSCDEYSIIYSEQSGFWKGGLLDAEIKPVVKDFLQCIEYKGTIYRPMDESSLPDFYREYYAAP